MAIAVWRDHPCTQRAPAAANQVGPGIRGLGGASGLRDAGTAPLRGHVPRKYHTRHGRTVLPSLTQDQRCRKKTGAGMHLLFRHETTMTDAVGAVAALTRRNHHVLTARTESPITGGVDHPDAYRMLELHPDARAEVITAAYKALRKIRHPGGRDADRAWKSELEWAYRTLANPVTRHAYDRDTRWARLKPMGPGHELPVYVGEGQYAGWRIDLVATRDPAYLETLARSSDPLVTRRIRELRG